MKNEQPPINKNLSDKFRQRLGVVLYVGAFTAVVALVCLHFINLPKAPYYTDEILTIFASRGVLQHGLPSFPTGLFYPNSLPNNYLVSLSMIIFGDNQLGHRTVSFVFSILCLLLTYLLSRKFFSRGISLAAVLLLALSQLETTYALSARMYVQLQFLSLFFVYSFYRGFWEGNKKFMWLSFVSLVFGIYTNLLMLLFIPPVLLYLTVQRKKWWRDKRLTLGLGVAALLVSLLFLLPNFLSVPGDWANAGVGNVVGFSLEHFWQYLRVFILEFPLGFIFILFATFLMVSQKEAREKSGYLLLNLTIPFLIIALTASHFRDRYNLILLPLYLILGVSGAQLWLNFLLTRGSQRSVTALKVLAIIVPIILIVTPGYIYRVGTGSTSRDYELASVYLTQHLASGDGLWCDELPITMMYAGRCDSIIAQRYQQGTFTGFANEKDVRFGTRILDSLPKIQEALKNHDRVWFIDTHYKPGDPIIAGQPEVVSYLEKNLELKFFDPRNYTAVFLYEE